MTHTFRLWAPTSTRVEAIVDGRGQLMSPSENGWWELEDSKARAGSLYSFRLDNGPSRPDPRSAYQPHGVHAESMLIDHNSYEWGDQGFQSQPLGSAIIYELHLGTFSTPGTFLGAIPHLEHLVELGVTHVEIMPVASFSGRWGWGYDGVHLFSPHSTYGSPDELKQLVDACHQCGLGVILDVVYNHLGPSGNYLPEFGPYFSDRYHTPWGAAINYDDHACQEVRRFICDNAGMWLRDYHFDGLRLDAVHAIFDTSALHILEQLADEVEQLQNQLGRHLFVIAESDLNQPRLIMAREGGSFGLDAMWNDDFHHALHSFLTGERSGYYADFGELAQLAKVYNRGFVFDGNFSVYRQAQHGRAWGNLPGQRLVVCGQNHDQIGNRALGDRLTATLNVQQLKLVAALVLTSPYVPLLFQGEEWATRRPFCYFTDHSDPELAEAVRQGRRQEFARFGWNPEQIPDPQAEKTFQDCKLDWHSKMQMPHQEVFLWYQELIKWRKSLPGLGVGRPDTITVEFDSAQQNWLLINRGTFRIVYNFSSDPQDISITDASRLGILTASTDGCRLEANTLRLPGQSMAILTQERRKV